MSYTRSWDDTIPAGSSQASTIDDSIRALRVDVHERMDDVFDNWISGPLKLKSSALGSQTKTLILGPHQGEFASASNGCAFADDYAEADDSGPAYRIPFILPALAEITKIQYFFDKNGSTSVTCKCKKVTLALSPAVSEVHTQLQSSNPGIQMVDTGTVSIIVAADSHYFLQFNGDFRFRTYGAKVYYTATVV